MNARNRQPAIYEAFLRLRVDNGSRVSLLPVTRIRVRVLAAVSALVECVAACETRVATICGFISDEEETKRPKSVPHGE